MLAGANQIGEKTMSEKQRNLLEQINHYNLTYYESLDKLSPRKFACEYGWYDWFCKDKSLVGKTVVYYKILNNLKIDNDVKSKYYVLFKNNCPCVGKLYDDIRFEPVDESKREQMFFVMTINDTRFPWRFNFFDYSNNFKEPIFTCNTTVKARNFVENYMKGKCNE